MSTVPVVIMPLMFPVSPVTPVTTVSMIVWPWRDGHRMGLARNITDVRYTIAGYFMIHFSHEVLGFGHRKQGMSGFLAIPWSPPVPG